MSISPIDAEVYLKDRAAEYWGDPSINSSMVKMLLQDDFLDDLGHQHNIEDYEPMIDQLSAGPVPVNESRRVITKRQLRRIIQKEINEASNWKPLSGEHAKELGEKPLDSGTEENPRQLAKMLINAINKGRVSAESLWAGDQVYIMTGAAKGITVQIIQRGRPPANKG